MIGYGNVLIDALKRLAEKRDDGSTKQAIKALAALETNVQNRRNGKTVRTNRKEMKFND